MVRFLYSLACIFYVSLLKIKIPERMRTFPLLLWGTPNERSSRLCLDMLFSSELFSLPPPPTPKFLPALDDGFDMQTMSGSSKMVRGQSARQKMSSASQDTPDPKNSRRMARDGHHSDDEVSVLLLNIFLLNKRTREQPRHWPNLRGYQFCL